MNRNNKPGRIVKGTAKQPNLKDASGIWTLDEAMQAHRANAWPQPDLLQPVPKSLKFKWVSGGGTGLYRYGMRGGNQQKFTLSTWFKKGTRNGVDDLGFLSANWGTTYASLHIATNQSNDGIQIYDWGSGLSGTFSITSIPIFRDPSAWYHLVVAVDTTQAIAFNRIKMWVNGVQITDFTNNNSWNTADGGFPPLNYATPVNRPGGLMTVGVSANNDSIMSSKTFDGQLAEYNFIDGYALTPTLFGTTTSTGRWIPKPYTGSHGTNGFYLPFDNNLNSQTLGYDASVNGTSIYDADQDPYRGSVALHLTGNGPAGGQNNTFVDSSPNNIAITRSGSTTQGSFSPFPLQDYSPYNPVVNGASAYFGTSTSDNVYAASNSALNFTTSNFTVEFWANWTAWAGEQRFILMGQSGSSALEIGRGTGSNILQVYTNTSLKISYSWSPAVGSWNHIAVVRTGTGAGQLVLYINGVNVATGTSADSIANNNFFVGGLNWAAGYNMQGYISNVRVFNGAAVYTSNFTPMMRPFGTLTNNLLPFSEDISNGVWTAQSQNVSFTPNAAIAPDGTPSATLIVPSTASATQNIAGLHDSPAGVNTFSIYAKSAGYRYFQCLHSRSAGGDSGYVTFDLTTGAVTNSSVWSGSVVNVGNGWYRLVATTTSLTGASGNSNVRWAFTDGSASRGPAFTGNGTSGIYVWGAQAELASSVGNYTPTPANYSTAPALLLNFANAAVVDSAGAGNIVTASGATITSSAKYGSGALAFNGSTDYFQSSWSLNNFLTPYVANWTLETWVYMTKSLSSVQVIANYGYESGTTRSFVWYYNGDGTFRLAQSPDGSTNYDAGFGAPQGGFALNTWYHLAIVRNSGAMTMYVNGKAMPNTLSAYNISNISTGVFRIGVDSSNYFGGSMDDVRLTKGVARYTTDFTPPARALPEVGGDSFATKGINAGVVRSFTTTGTTSWTAPRDVTQVEVLVVGGGGGGGHGSSSGGGGGGGLIYNTAYPVTPGQTYTVTVGAGGAGTNGSTGGSGGNSVFGPLTAIGGGGGGGAGGSGGGSAGATIYAGTAGQGFAGGAGFVDGSAYYRDGGGGGAAGVGGNASTGTGSPGNGGNGGNGLQFSISGTPTYYAGGGGGAGWTRAGPPHVTPGTGGSGGGGAGSLYNIDTPTAGTANTGGGGGASNNGAAGGSGIVIIRYTTASEVGSTEDSLVDSPTNYGHDMQLGGEVIGNYCTLNPLTNTKVGSIGTIGDGNLLLSGVLNQRPYINGTMFVSTGKWYCEVTVGAWGNEGDNKSIGITNIDVNAASIATFIGTTNGYHRTFTNAFSNDLTFNDGSGTATHQLVGANFWSTDNTTYGLAIDIDNNTMSLYKNGVLAYTKTSAGLSGYSWTVYNEMESSSSRTPATNWKYNFGQRPWIYTPPAGYNAWNTKNLPILTASAAINPNQYFDAVTYMGTGTSLTVSGFNFQPDLLWIKERNGTSYHRLFDRVRGATNSPSLYSNATSAEGADNLTFTSTGFTYSTDPYSTGMNVSGNTHVAWGWKAGGAPVSNTSGTITSQVSANTASGFSIVTWTGSANGVGTMGHGLGAIPKLIITKQRNQTGDWYVYTTVLDGTNRYLKLNAKNWSGSTGVTAPTTSVFSNDSWTSSSNMVAYCWAEVPGFSKIGTYKANNDTNGPFVSCGFRPRWIMVKTGIDTDNVYPSGNSWEIYDTARNTFNSVSSSGSIMAEEASVESMRASFIVTATGFKVVSTGSRTNYPSNATFLFMAFADTPFKGATAASQPVPTRTPVATVFGYTGADQSYVVPAGVTKIRVAAWGAGGSAGSPTTGGALTGNGGGAGSVEGWLDVVPGETLTVKVGQGADYGVAVGNGTETNLVFSSGGTYGGGGQNGSGDGAGSNAGTAGAGGGASSILRSGTYLVIAAGGGGAAGAGYGGSNPSSNGGAGGAGAGTGGAGRGVNGNPSASYVGSNGSNGGGGGGGGGSGSNVSVGNGDPGLGGTNTVPVTCTGYSGSTRTPGNTGSALWDGTAGYGGIAPSAGGFITTPDGRVVIIA